MSEHKCVKCGHDIDNHDIAKSGKCRICGCYGVTYVKKIRKSKETERRE